MKKWAVVATIGAALFASSARAWNAYGHMEVAAVAWENLSPTIRNKAIALLRLNPDYDDWISGVAPKDRDKFAFMRASTWPDAIKSKPGYRNDGLEGSNGNRPNPNDSSSFQNIGYADKLRHKYWHFVDIPFSPDGTDTIPADVPNAQTQIATFRAALASNSGKLDDVRSFDLAWLLHIVGDIHQPLHSTQRFTKTTPDGDAGGNGVKIECGSGCSSIKDLHTFWDDVLGTDDNNLAAISAAAAALPKPDASRASIADEKTWAEESFELAKQRAYALPHVGHGSGPFALTTRYKDDARAIAEECVALAGVRLAYLISDALK
jgi:hypothetical protein